DKLVTGVQTCALPILCQTIDERSLRLLGDILERQQVAADDVTEFMALDEEFHLSMARMAGLQRTARIIASLRGVLWLMGTRIVRSEERRVGKGGTSGW